MPASCSAKPGAPGAGPVQKTRNTWLGVGVGVGLGLGLGLGVGLALGVGVGVGVGVEGTGHRVHVELDHAGERAEHLGDTGRYTEM